MIMRNDEGACRYYGTLHGIFALLKAKGVVSDDDMNDLVGYSELATKSIQKIIESVRIIDPPVDSYDRLFSRPLSEKQEALDQLLEAADILASMSGPTAILDKIIDGVGNKINTAKEQERDERKSKLKILDGGDDGKSSES